MGVSRTTRSGGPESFEIAACREYKFSHGFNPNTTTRLRYPTDCSRNLRFGSHIYPILHPTEKLGTVGRVFASPSCLIISIGSCAIIVIDMPAPPKRAANTNKSPYAWTTGNKRSITHVAPIGNGGFGEVHKV